MPKTDQIKIGERFTCESVPVEWIEASAGGEDAPKKVAIVAYTGGAMRVGLYFSPVVLDLAGLQAGGDTIPLLLNHDPAQIVGHGTPGVTAQRIKIGGVVSGGGPAAEEVKTSAAKGFPWKASVGVIPHNNEFVSDGATAKANGRTWKGPVNIIRAGTLEEVSFVPIAADRRTSVSVAAQRKEFQMDSFQEWLVAAGFEPDALTEEQTAPLKAAFDAEQKAEKEAADPEKKKTPPPLPVNAGNDGATLPLEGNLADYRKRLAAETKRAGAVRAACAQYAGKIETEELTTIEATAVEEEWSQDKVELTLIRAGRPKAPAAHSGNSPETTGRVIEAAACLALGLPAVEKQFDEKTLEAADRNFRREIGLQEMLMVAAQANGYQARRMRVTDGNLREILAAALPPIHAAGEATGFDLSGIFSNVLRKSLLAQFNYVESIWKEVADIGTVPDFKTMTRYRMTGDAQYEKLGPKGEIQHGTLDEESFTISADTYARMYGLERTDIINDDLGALNSISRKLGRGAALKINDVFWTAFLDNGSFFTAGRSNYVTGTASALDGTDPVAALAKAEQTFMDQTDADSKPLGVLPQRLLVPTALSAHAREAFQSTGIMTGGSSTKTRQPTTNIYAGRFDPIVSAYLGNSSYTGYSVKAWYLLADPRDLAVIEIAFLNGNQAPTVESADADFNTLGILFRGYHDFGVSKQEYRAGVKLTGEAA